MEWRCAPCTSEGCQLQQSQLTEEAGCGASGEACCHHISVVTASTCNAAEDLRCVEDGSQAADGHAAPAVKAQGTEDPSDASLQATTAYAQQPDRYLIDALSCPSSRLVWMSATYLASCNLDGRPAGAFGIPATEYSIQLYRPIRCLIWNGRCN